MKSNNKKIDKANETKKNKNPIEHKNEENKENDSISNNDVKLQTDKLELQNKKDIIDSTDKKNIYSDIKLYKINVENFKSFEGKHEIGYFQNFSVVMGPNGSGKSNIIDAICFALGMKTVSLRTKNLKELIYKKNSDIDVNEEEKKLSKNTIINRNNIDEDIKNNKNTKRNKKQEIPNSISSENDNNRSAYVELNFRCLNPFNINILQASQINNFINKTNINNKKNLKSSSLNKMDLEGEEFLLIKFKRTISTKGNSEYFIDDKKTNYEEYLEKLEKLNIPSKARYFILVQGAIDTLLSKKNDLSETIEFLSGSIDYKEEYQSLKNQIDNINAEMSKHSSEINSIKMDKNKIKMQIQNEEKFNELISELNHLLEKLFLFRIVNEDMLINNNLSLLSQNEVSLKSIQEEKKNNLDKIKKNNLEVKNLESSVKFDDAEGEAIKKEYEESNSNLINCNEKIKLYEAQIFGKISMINQKKIDITKNLSKKNELNSSLEKLEKEIQMLKMKIDLDDPSLNIPKPLIEEYRKISYNYDLEAFTLKNQINELQKEITEAKNKQNLTDKKKDSSEVEKLNLEKELKNSKEKEITEIENRAKLEEKIRSLKNGFIEKTKENEESQKIYSSLKTKQEELQKRLTEYENYSNENSRRKKISELILKNEKVYGFLFELITPIKKQLELPVKVSLLKYLGYLIVEDTETAKQCSEFFKQKEISADVIVLENIPQKSFDENLRNILGSLGNLVVDLIDCKKKGIKEAIRYFIKDVVLCHDPNQNNLNTIRQRGFTSIITLDGTSYKKGTITSGNYKNLEQYSFNYMANSIEEFAKLENEANENELKIKELEEKINNKAFEGLNKIKLKLSESENLSEASNRQIKSIIENISRLKNEIKEKDNFMNITISKQLEEINEILIIKKMKLTELENNQTNIQNKFFEEFMKKHNIVSLKIFEAYSIEEIKRLVEEAKILEEKKIKIKIQIKSFDSQDEILEKLEKSLQEDKEKKKLLEFDKENLDKIFKKISKAFELYKDNKNEDYKKIKILKDEIEKVNSDLDRIENRIRALLKNKVDFTHKIKTAIENKKNILQESKLNLENYITEIGVNLSSVFISFYANLENHLIENNEILEKQNLLFDISLIEKKNKYSEKSYDDFDFVNEKMQKIKTKFCEKIKDLDKYVKIITLIDNEYDKLRDREDELTNKKREINLLIQSLIEECDTKKIAFEEVKAKRKNLFDQFFEKLSQKLSEVYKDLTKPLDNNSPGGSVYIYKTNNEEPFLGNVCYLPTPPGKRCIHDIDLLSGGEKTIAILCLLISIQSICNTPIIILDEIDAYLDPHHELMLERLFKRKSDDFQIIIVTHKSNIFRSAHTLIGTYFNKKKNSSIPLSLDMKKLLLQD